MSCFPMICRRPATGLSFGGFASRSLLAALCFWLGAGAALDARAADFTAWPSEDWSVAKPEAEGISSPKLDKLRDYLESCGSKTGLVVRHGRIVGEWYWRGGSPSTPYMVYSTSKSISSTATGLAIARGKLKLESTVGEFLPDAAPAEKREITVRQILSMTTGMFNNKDLGHQPTIMTYALTQAPMAHPPGSHWEYNNTGLALLGPLFAKATGEEIDAFAERELFKPIGIAKADWTWDRNEDHTIPYSGLHITGRALARIGLLFLNEGRWQGREIVPAAWVAQATAPSQELNRSYGFLWWNNVDGTKWKGVPKDAYAALGKLDNNMFILPAQELIVIRQVGDDTETHKVDQAEILRLAVAAIDDQPDGAK